MNKLVNEELNKMKYLLGYQKGKVISEQALVSSTTPPAAAPSTQTSAAPAATVEDVIKQIQTTLNTKYGAKLTVDGKWGNLTQTAFEAATKSKAAGTPAAAPTGTTQPAAAPTGTGTQLPTVTVTGQKAPDPAIAAAPKVALPSVMAPTVPGVSYQTQPTTQEPAAQSPDEIVGTEVAPQSNRDQRRERQDMRRDQRRARQDLRAQQRAQ
jgi:hypothetical protein